MTRLWVMFALAAVVLSGHSVRGAGLSGLSGLDGTASDSCANTPKCKCKWSSGKSVADCSNAGLTAIPSTLKPEIQTVILDGNPLGSVHKDAFKMAGLVNLHKISMKNCSLKYVDENAFSGLRILIDLDLSFNDIPKLKLKTFEDNPNLQFLKMSRNPLGALQAFQFPQLKNLKTLDFSHCALETIDSKTFQNLGASVESISLNDNRLKYLDVGLFTSLSLRTIQLHNNPWVCDCKLNGFREWLISKQLDTKPTACNEPQRLHERLWDEISQTDFACKPEMLIPRRFVFATPGVNATLSCLISGSPMPRVQWVKDGLTVSNNSSPKHYPDQRLIIREESASFLRNLGRWYNLTITSVGHSNLGDYVCVAENNAGMMERNVTLTFDDPETLTKRGGILSEKWAVIVGITSAGVVFIGLMILLCCCCLCRRKKVSEKKNVKSSENGKSRKENGSGLSAYGNETTLMSNMTTRQTLDYNDEESQALLAQHKISQQVFNPMMSTPRTNESLICSGLGQDPRYIPDLLEASNLMRTMSSPLNQNTLPIRKTSTPLSVVSLMQNSPDSASFHRSGTLPHHYHFHYPGSGQVSHHGSGRSISCDHTNGMKPGHHTLDRPGQQLPMVHYHHTLGHHGGQSNHSKQARPGYVTLPRRPRASWSAPPPPHGMCTRDTPSPCLSQFAGRTEFREPIYDGVGPRTSADGSSKANLNTTTLPRNQHLNKSFDTHSYGVRTPLSSGNGYTLPPYYAPIEEVQECPPTPKERPRSTPNILDLSDALQKPRSATHNQGNDSMNNNDSSVPTSSSEITLIEENISAYCEPFGKALPPPESLESESRPVTTTPTRSSVATCSSAGSELELLLPQQRQEYQKGKQNHSPNNDVDAMIANKRQYPVATARRFLSNASPQELDDQRSGKLSHQELQAKKSLTESQQNRPPHLNNSFDGSGSSNSRPTSTISTSSVSPNVLNNNVSPNTSVDNANPDVSLTSFNGNDTPSKKVPPKTLPKPKIRPVPPPKPKKSAIWVPPPFITNSFQDESADGSEV